MAQADNQTRLTGKSVIKFLKSVSDPQQRADSFDVLKIMEQATGEKPKMWGPAIVGYGFTILKYASGREVESPYTGFSPRKGNITFYIDGIRKADKSTLTKLGKHKISGGCLHVKHLSDIDKKVLKDIVAASVKDVKSKL